MKYKNRLYLACSGQILRQPWTRRLRAAANCGCCSRYRPFAYHLLKGLCTGFIVFSLLLSPNFSASFVQNSFHDLVQKANFIVRGTVKATEVFQRDNHIWTRYEFLIAEFIRGSGPSILFFEQPGGQTKEFITKVAGVRQFNTEDQLCLFLWAEDNNFQVLGFGDGCFELEENIHGELTVKKFNREKEAQNIRFSVNQLEKKQLGNYENFHKTWSWDDFKLLIRSEE